MYSSRRLDRIMASAGVARVQRDSLRICHSQFSRPPARARALPRAPRLTTRRYHDDWPPRSSARRAPRPVPSALPRKPRARRSPRSPASRRSSSSRRPWDGKEPGREALARDRTNRAGRPKVASFNMRSNWIALRSSAFFSFSTRSRSSPSVLSASALARKVLVLKTGTTFGSGRPAAGSPLPSPGSARSTAAARRPCCRPCRPPRRRGSPWPRCRPRRTGSTVAPRLSRLAIQDDLPAAGDEAAGDAALA